MATLRKRYVDPDVSGGAGNGTSWANAYASLNAAEQAEDNSGNIAGSDEYVEFVCGHNGASQTTADTTAVTIGGWTTDPTRYIHVYTESADRHAGVWSDSKYRLNISDNVCLYLQEDYVRIDGLQITNHSPAGNALHLYSAAFINAANDLRLSNSILKGHNHGTYTQTAINLGDGDMVFTGWNLIIYDIAAISSNFGITGNVASCAVYGATIIGGSSGIYASGTFKNVYVANSSFEDFRAIGTCARVNCASEDASADDTGATETATDCLINKAYSTANFESVTPGESTYLKVKSGGALHEAGTTLSDDPPGSTALGVDIAGNSRTATWDIGAFEYVVAGRTTRNTRSHPLGLASGMGFSIGGRA